MANIIIVTKHCYLLCEAINYISVQEADEDDDKLSVWSNKPKKKVKKKPTRQQVLMERLEKEAKLYAITISFDAVQGPQGSSSRREERSAVSIQVRGYNNCLSLFKDMVHQIREQMPDKLFLDKLVEKFFSENPDPKS